MRVYVISLKRRPDRRAAVEAQASRLGFSFVFLDAVDGKTLPAADFDRLSRPGAMGPINPGDLGCFLSHRAVWSDIVAGSDAHAIVLEDDVELADDAARFFNDSDWISPAANLVKLECYGRSKILLSSDAVGIASRRVHRLYSKNSGTAAYVISKSAAQLCLDASAVVDIPVDHFLFNPANSPVFDALAPHLLSPSIARQRHVGSSDIVRERLSQSHLLQHPIREIVRFWHDVRVFPKLVWTLASGRGQLFYPAFAKLADKSEPGS